MTYSRWWWGLKEDDRLSVIDLVDAGTLDYKTVGLLWLLMERRASLLVAAGPSFAGKSTLLHALLDFLPPDIEQVALRGYAEDFKLTGIGRPEKTFLVTEEISNHSYEYLWGRQVVRALELIPGGYALGGTIHARNIKEVAYVLNALGAPLSLIAGLGVVVTLQVRRGRYYDDEPLRYVDTVSTLSLSKEGLTAQFLAARHSAEEKFLYPPEQTLRDALSGKFAVSCDQPFSEMDRRAGFLRRLSDEGVSSREEVRKRLSEYSRS